MADLLKTLKHEELVAISRDFDYLSATAEFVGLKLMPMARTENMKVAIYELLKGNEIRVSALVHALDSEARIGDRPEYEEIRNSLFLIKEKINQGEELRKKIKDLGMDASDNSIILSIYDDIANEISKVLVGFERRACELLSTGKITVDENGAKFVVDQKLSADNKVPFSGWNDPKHDIVGDLIALQKKANKKIKRFIISDKIMGYILNNEKLNEIATKDTNQGYLTQDYALNYMTRIIGSQPQFVVDDRKYKLSYKTGAKEYYYLDPDTVIALTTTGEIGKTFMTSTPIEDGDTVDRKYGFVAVSQWRSEDPVTSWTKAEGVGLPVIRDINNTLYLSKITATTVTTGA